MLRLLRSELEYHKRIITAFIISALMLSFYSTNSFVEDLSANYILFLLMFLVLQNWNTLRNKEKRDFQIVQLPLSMRTIALHRIGMTVVVMVLLAGPYALVHYFVFGPADHIRLLIAVGIVLMGFSIHYLIRDLLLPVLRRIGFTRSRIIWTLAIVLVALNVIGVLFFLRSSATDSTVAPPNIIIQFIRFIKNATAHDLAKVFVPGFIFAGLTLISFGRRKSYFE